MPDLSIPQRQTFPYIRGQASDQNGPMPLLSAESLTLCIEVIDGDLFELPASALDPTEPTSVFKDANGDDVGANFHAPIGLSGLTDDVTTALRGKLQITWDSDATPPLVEFVPSVGFMTFAITENVQASV